MNTKKQTASPHSSAEEPSGPVWVEEWVPLNAIIKHPPFQVRGKLDRGAVKRYADQTAAGSKPPPIKLARVQGSLYLLDGWHRMEAGALQTAQGLEAVEVLAQVAPMREAEARWEAARANMGHGLQLKSREFRKVFQAFIKAGMHKLHGGKLMSYRDMAPHIGKSYRTLHEWMRKDFPRIAQAMGEDKAGNAQAEAPHTKPPTLAEEHLAAALGAAQQTLKALPHLDAQQRHLVAEQWRAVAAEAERLGAVLPEGEPF